jgi:hypothetical protein
MTAGPSLFGTFVSSTVVSTHLSSAFGTDGKAPPGRISKQGDLDLRRLLMLGATKLLRHARGKPRRQSALP